MEYVFFRVLCAVFTVIVGVPEPPVTDAGLKLALE
jgi:hypothetical protein